MNKIKILLVSILLSSSSPAFGMENAQDAVNDTRTVPVIAKIGENPWKVCTGFLYSSKIVLTAGHCLFNKDTKQAYEQLYVGLPGKPYFTNATKILIDKIFFPKDWSYRGENDFTDISDFGILILSTPIDITGKTIIADEQAVSKYLNNNSMLSTIGYGKQSFSHKESEFTFPKYAEFPMAPFNYVEQELKKFSLSSGQKKYYGMKIHIAQFPGGPSTCNGDSGSALYIKNQDDYTYFGPIAWGIGGMPNCSGKPWEGTVMYIGSVAAYDYLYLIKEAENYVGNTQTIEINNIKKTIKCIKNKKIKKIISENPKCPRGYKVKV